MTKDRSRLTVGITYLLTYLLACLIGMLLYAGLRGKWEVLVYLPLIPMLFPHGLAIAVGCYDVNPSPLQYAVAFGPFIIAVVLGIWTKRTVFFLVFVALLLINIGGCVITGVEDTKRDKRHSNHTSDGIRQPADGLPKPSR